MNVVEWALGSSSTAADVKATMGQQENASAESPTAVMETQDGRSLILQSREGVNYSNTRTERLGMPRMV